MTRRGFAQVLAALAVLSTLVLVGQAATATTSVTPVVFHISPNQGPTTGGTSVKIFGFNLDGATKVDFGSSAATFSVTSNNEIQATSPAGTGTVSVTVTTPNGTSATNNRDQFTYESSSAQRHHRR